MEQNVMMRCKAVAELLTSDRLGDEPFWVRLQVKLHLGMCKYCSRLARQMEQLRLAASRFSRSFDRERAGPEGEDLEARLLRRLSEKRR
jgi:predicted anti-sigma-YlaC factor YlaD